MSYEVKLTELASVTAAHVRSHTTTAAIGEAVGQGLKELFEFAVAAGAAPAGPPQLAYPGQFEPGAEVDLDLYLPISKAVSPKGAVDVVELPGGPVAQTFHQGRYDTIGAAYEAVFRWIHTTDRHRAGPPREIYLTGPDATSSPADYLTEVVVPLRRTGS
ncbi:effector-binding domain-containing protein [Lentzea waywayandensis]|uniref:Effector-binding domain-containing protein n=1 Tax=Lentzea waywayandensis TaxID=84724 RepID=A0A1I6D9D5_9PSEU|nr:GyrI-like domain-containing protein [Lentzea waywayandensis]SFR02053.1 effector-binding domain-containing protein [Lentzea waywayandensis]